MRESKYLRLALMFGDNNATTFSKNLEKMISLVLHDHYEEPLSVVEIIDELKELRKRDSLIDKVEVNLYMNLANTK